MTQLFKLIDTHAHLEELESLDFMLEEAKQAGVVAIVAVGSNYLSNLKTLEIAHNFPSLVYPAVGLHPCELADLAASQIDETLEFISQTSHRAVAIGEIGLDYDKRVVKATSKALQGDVLKRLLKLAKEHAKPAVIHSRYAWKDALQLVKDAEVGKVVFHWFTGFSSVLNDIISSGYFISATPATEYHEEHRRAVREIPLDRLLLETDCPVAYGRESKYKSRPADVSRTLKAVAKLKGIDESTIAEQTTKNAIDFFNLDLTL